MFFAFSAAESWAFPHGVVPGALESRKGVSPPDSAGLHAEPVRVAEEAVGLEVVVVVAPEERDLRASSPPGRRSGIYRTGPAGLSRGPSPSGTVSE